MQKLTAMQKVPTMQTLSNGNVEGTDEADVVLVMVVIAQEASDTSDYDLGFNGKRTAAAGKKLQKPMAAGKK